MLRGEEIDLREGLVYDAAVKGFDSNFWKGDTANLTCDTIKAPFGASTGAILIGDTGKIGAMSSYSQYLYGDFEFTVRLDSLSPDSNDGADALAGKKWGLINMGDTLERGAAYFEMDFDSVAGGETTVTRPFRTIIVDEAGNRYTKNITWDTLWGGNGKSSRYRITWEQDGYTFLVNDTVVSTMGCDRIGNITPQINTSIPQALRLQNSVSAQDVVDSGAMELKFVAIRNARKII